MQDIALTETQNFLAPLLWLPQAQGIRNNLQAIQFVTNSRVGTTV